MKKRGTIGNIIRTVAIAAVVTAVAQELRKPTEQRTWRGTVWGFMPYDFTLPTVARLKEAYWNPEDPAIITPRPLGIGWAVNVPSLIAAVKQVIAEVRESCGCCS